MNRGYLYGDAFFETIAVKQGQLLFFERHYLRMASSIRLLKMNIPQNFTMETLAMEIKQVLQQEGLATANARVRISVHRQGKGRYTPETNELIYTTEAWPLQKPLYVCSDSPCKVELYQTHVAPKGSVLYNLKTNNRILNVLAGLYAQEHNMDSIFLVNQDKNVVEAFNGNVFVVKGDEVWTPPLSEGCVKGVLRSKLIDLIEKGTQQNIEERPIPISQLQGADELFITNVILGIQPVTHFRRKEYKDHFASYLLDKINQALPDEAF